MKAQEVINELIGLTEKELESYAKQTGLDYRITNRDSVPYIVTRDFHPSRANIIFNRGIITGVSFG